jgi:PknH-like extracellular domain
LSDTALGEETLRQRIGALAMLAGVCLLVGGCADVVDGTSVAADKYGPLDQGPIPAAALDGLLLDVSQINSAVGARSIKVWFSAKTMWDWSKNVSDRNCLAIDGPAQDKVYSGTGWTAMRGHRLDDSVDGSKKRKHYAIQAVVAFPSAHDASTFYNNSMQSWSACSNRRFSDASPNQPDILWTVAGITNDNSTLSTSQVQEGGDGWTCQRALTVRNNISIDIVSCAYSQSGSVAIDIAQQIAAKTAKP